MKTLIMNNAEDLPMSTVATFELVIGISKDGAYFKIFKNRLGRTFSEYSLPIEILPKVIANPSGRPAQDWI